ncbi:MAG: prepilin peptidase [Lachnospiraceae bacterium]|nr:prepilin peptidase [Lachnospiraceae bacterium]
MRILNGLILILLSVCTYTDIRKREISGSLCLLFFVLGFLYRGICGHWWMGVLEGILRLLPGLLVLFLHVLKKNWIGTGDGILLLTAGYMAGAEAILRTALLAFVISGLAGAALLIAKRKNKTDTLPFAPFLLGAFVTVLIVSAVKE